jgi:hypothetical protein
MGHEDIALQTVLQAQKSGLITRSHSSKVLDSAGLPVSKINTNWKAVDEYQKGVGFSDKPVAGLDSQGRAALLLGFYNIPHLGHRNLSAAAMFALRGIPVLVSINKYDPTRLNHPNIKPLSFKNRSVLVVNNLMGLIGNGVYVSSIDFVSDPNLEPPLRMSNFGEKTNAKTGRVCGYDRINLTPDTVDPILIGMRGRDLQKILQDTEIMAELKKRYPRQNISLLVLQGTTKASSTSVYHLAEDTLGEIRGSNNNLGRLNQLRSQTHPANRIPILNFINQS